MPEDQNAYKTLASKCSDAIKKYHVAKELEMTRKHNLGSFYNFMNGKLETYNKVTEVRRSGNNLYHRFAVEGKPLLWFKSYRTNRSQSFSVEGVQSKSIVVDCSVPHARFRPRATINHFLYRRRCRNLHTPPRPSSPVR